MCDRDHFIQASGCSNRKSPYRYGDFRLPIGMGHFAQRSHHPAAANVGFRYPDITRTLFPGSAPFCTSRSLPQAALFGYAHAVIQEARPVAFQCKALRNQPTVLCIQQCAIMLSIAVQLLQQRRRERERRSEGLTNHAIFVDAVALIACRRINHRRNANAAAAISESIRQIGSRVWR